MGEKCLYLCVFGGIMRISAINPYENYSVKKHQNFYPKTLANKQNFEGKGGKILGGLLGGAAGGAAGGAIIGGGTLAAIGSVIALGPVGAALAGIYVVGGALAGGYVGSGLGDAIEDKNKPDDKK